MLSFVRSLYLVHTMNIPRPFLTGVLLVGTFAVSACNVQQPNGNSAPVSQTQQGIHVGLNIVASSQSVQQPSTSDQVTIMSPDLQQPVKSPLSVHGRVSGTFFSEGVFPVVLRDSAGREIARALAHADGEWMTNDAVPFTVQLEYKAKPGTKAVLVFEKDNPSGLPENDHSQEFTVTLQ